MPNDKVKTLKQVITFAMREVDADSLDASFAMAQLLGVIAAKMDQHQGVRPFEDRWKEITNVARTEYHKVLGVRTPILVEPNFPF